MISQVLFVLILVAATFWFTRNLTKIIRNIQLGRDVNRKDRSSDRWMTMVRVALGQSKMVVRPVAGIMHIFVYVGFIIINFEVLEIVIDGIFGTHRFFSSLGPVYNLLIASFEVLALLVLVGVLVFLARRNILKLKRFWMKEMTSWPRTDANIILITEVLLMTAFLTMNATDSILQAREFGHYIRAGSFPVSTVFAGSFSGMSSESLEMIERFCWWFHIVGILLFLNYIPYSKHFHILLSFPNTYYSNLEAKGRFTNMESVTREVKLMLDPSAILPPGDPNAVPQRFGAKDVYDLTWKQLMDAYSCTECGRCSSSCPANQTGKLLSPRKIMMDTRDRLEEVGKNIDRNGKDFRDEKSLLNYITEEELWACTSCNACTEACPVNIDPLSIIIDMRRYLVMEESKVPQELAGMFNKIENNGAPWQFAQADRFNWANAD
ncbi:MAG TPA: 4Fe-4S dicluster domain-containing protein [Bacteroidia bacterium]|nr:4Fe-4S dicluster domain-containing protein [Bacteroidia bacterium]